MVEIQISSSEVVLRPRGLHRLWALKGEIRIPLNQLKRVDVGVTPEARQRLSRSLRLPGTYVPRVITAGSYRCNGKWAFWDVVGKGENAVTLSTEGHHYTELVVDVSDTKATIHAFERVIG